ncbi:uncharacterized protein ACLA_033400 [Aspergillus clavatus NRRL 1]|uniref:Uncharacterized protein n=1 Tax=Aspergillus clavatus (strain ATCC 1007 / CBS 513.65 / DSM 816 / NCTC 3887 / NRRL 1 / QM 1276 / 107) TaxID=344612 RepID=A1CJ13_ASPCL|nr:uncharacterized protein ACLA_033400 [Aspergillus clavatus NRRL 1]EAW09137.1 conserved hypothetical protein [Aspergillus clavatus NRRL 1]
MEEHEAHPDTQGEVDLLILDYLVCTAINAFICTQQRGEQGQAQGQSAGWLLWTANNLTPSLAQPETVSRDMTLKLKIIDLINICCRNASHGTSDIEVDSVTLECGAGSSSTRTRRGSTLNPNGGRSQYDASNKQALLCQSLCAIAPSFLSLCTVADDLIGETDWTDIAAQLMLKAAIGKHQICDGSSMNIFNEQMEQIPEFMRRSSKWKQVSDKYNEYIHPPPGISMLTHIETTLRQSHLNRLGDAIIDFLSILMKKLCPPILLQLEKGKLRGLSRKETRDLLCKAGLR